MKHAGRGRVRPSGLLVTLMLLAAGCRSLAERTHVGGTDERDEVAEREQAGQAAGLGNLIGGLIYFSVAGCDSPVDPGH